MQPDKLLNVLKPIIRTSIQSLTRKLNYPFPNPPCKCQKLHMFCFFVVCLMTIVTSVDPYHPFTPNYRDYPSLPQPCVMGLNALTPYYPIAGLIIACNGCFSTGDLCPFWCPEHTLMVSSPLKRSLDGLR